MKPCEFSIGTLSVQAGVKVETIRYYERIGLVLEPRRTQGKHRLYDQAALSRLRFVRRARELGFSLSDIRSLLGLDGGKPSCGEVYDLTSRHLADVRSRIADLRKLERTLSKVASECNGGKALNCPVIEALATEGRRAADGVL